jgi:alpha-galactosidase/6-phospho-beta-glucosidase family protein
MQQRKVVVIGAGSYVFGPSMLAQILLENEMTDLELALVDLDRVMVDTMTAIGERIAREKGLRVRINAHTDRRAALPGAAAVLCAVARESHRRWLMDVEVVKARYPDHLITEFGGVAGISYTLRQLALFRGIAADVQELAPEAWILNSSNPLARVCQAVHEEGVRCAGFCSVALRAYEFLAEILEGRREVYPYAVSKARYALTLAGPNHFTWLVRGRDRTTGADVVAQLRERIAGARRSVSASAPRCCARQASCQLPGTITSVTFCRLRDWWGLRPKRCTARRQSDKRGLND